MLNYLMIWQWNYFLVFLCTGRFHSGPHNDAAEVTEKAVSDSTSVLSLGDFVSQ